MTTDLSHELDRLAIMDLLIRYANSVDCHDFEGIRSCLADDLVFVGFGRPDPGHGGDAYTDLIRELLKPFGATQHLLGNQVVELDGDVAHVATHVQVTHFLVDDPNSVQTLWAAYVDDMERVGEGHEWIITHRELQRTGAQTTTNVP